MSYLVLARKWRPQTFEEVVGQPHVVQTLSNAIAADRIAHAYLCSGARGVGKTSVARILAKALNCEQGPTTIPCNQCNPCQEITAGTSLDVLEIDGASNRGINEIRELRENIRYRPARSKYKIYIIDEVHMLTGEAFNALLKTLEEPPAHAVFIFATTEVGKIPATILSRCQRFDFRRLSVAAIVSHLSRIAAAEGVNVSEASLRLLAQEAEGSMRDAQSLLEQMIAFAGKEITERDLLEILGVIDRQSLIAAAGALVDGDTKTCLEVVQRLYLHGHDLRRFCRELAQYFRNLLVLKVNAAAVELLEVDAGEMEELQAQADRVTGPLLQQYIQLLLKAEEEIRRAANPKLTMELALLRMLELPKVMSLDSIIARLVEMEGRQAATGQTAAAQHDLADQVQGSYPSGKDGTPGTTGGVSDAEGEDPAWERILRQLRQERPALAASLQQAEVKEVEPHHFELDFNGHEFEYDLVREPENLELLRRAASAELGEQARVSMRIGSKPAPGTQGEATRKRSRALRQQALKHPMVAEALDVFGGEIVEVRVNCGDKE